MSPLPGLTEILKRFRSRQVRPKVTRERVDAIDIDGDLIVAGGGIPTIGIDPGVAVGQHVPVIWKDRRRALVLRHHSKRAKAVPFTPITGGALLESLFIATDPDTGDRDVWFRNDQVVAALGVRADLPGDPEYAKWSTDGTRMIVKTAGEVYSLFALDRTLDKVLGTTIPTATFERTVDVEATATPLCTLHRHGIMSGETQHVATTRELDADGFLIGATSEMLGAIAATGEQELTDVVLLDARLLSGTGAFQGRRAAVIDEVHVDDAGDLLAVVQVNLSLVGTHSFKPPTVFGSKFTFGNPTACVFPSVEVSVDPLFTYPRGGNHVFLVNVTRGTVLWKTCLDTIESLVQSEVHEFNGAQIKTTRPGFDDVCVWKPWPAFDWLAVPPAPPAFTVLSDYGNLGVYGQTSRSLTAWDRDRLPFIEDEGTHFANADTATEVRDIQQLQTEVKFSRTQRTINQIKEYSVAGSYAPRRAIAFDAAGIPTSVPLGIMYLKVRREPVSTSTPPVQIGAYAVDCDRGTVTPLQALTDQVASGQTGAHPGFAPDNLTYPWIGFITANLHRVLYRIRSGPVSSTVRDEIRFASLDTGASITLATIDQPASNETSNPPVAALTPIMDFLRRRLALLRPDFLYWPDDSNEDANVLLDAWDRSSGALHLTLTPAPDEALRPAGLLAELPDGVTPIPPSHLRDENEGEPIIPGPSYQAVRDSEVLAVFSVTEPDE